MSVTAGTKITTSDITSDFLTNVVATVFSGAYHNGDVPHFSGTTYRNSSYNANDNVEAFTSPAALPVSDLDSYSNAYPNVSIGNKGDKISGATVYNALYGIVSGLSRVRNFASYWYHQNNGSLSLVASKSGKAIFNSSLPALPGFSAANSSATSGWQRSTNTSIQAVSVDGTSIAKGRVASANNINQFFANLRNAWGAAAANAIEYRFYTCHRNCHGNCHGSRGRR
jgi:hypothetical protein